MAYPTTVQQPAQFNAQAQPGDGRYSVSPEPDANGNNGNGQRHHRAYQACEACRERKVKCDMGPVDQPHEPPCAKCKREHKQCVFSSSRKKSPSRRSISNSNTNGTNGVKRARTGSIIDETAQRARPAPTFQSPGFHKPSFSTPASFAGSPASTTPNPSRPVHQVRPHSNGLPQLSRSSTNLRPIGADDQFHSKMVADLLSTPIASSQDGMQLLFQAAAETSGQSPSVIQSPHSDTRRSRTFSANHTGQNDIHIPIRGPEHAAEIDRALEVWSRMRFVRAGWISASEAMNYIEYFYARLAPMTPVVTPDYRSPSKHAQLLTEEPVLTMTILAITSRQMPLQGVGANSRSFNVHDKLWDALRRMIERLLWGQEQFGGGFFGAGAAPIRESKTGQITWKGSLRTLGTIEALLLLTDWQPRALHFPPSGDDENWLIDGSRAQLLGESVVNEEEGAVASGGVALASSLEPGWRSDRMSWMLLGLAQSLAFELGVFDNDHDPREMRDGQFADYVRRRRLRRLVLLFVAQTSGRIGMKSMLSPEADRDHSPYANYQEDSVDRMQKLWLEIASIMYNANLDIFLSRQQTKNLLDTNKYRDEIDKLTPRVHRWKQQFDRISDEFSPTMKSVMLMEYEYARLFINSPSFNKVVETWRNQGPQVNNSTLAQVAEENKKYINEVKEAATNLVSTALQGFAEKSQLRDAPVRTYLRSFAGMVFTLKLFSLGNHEASVRKFISLLDHIAEAMETQVVDDVHISMQIASVVKALLANVKNSFIRVQKSGTNSGPPSREQSRAQSPYRHLQRHQSKTSVIHDSRYPAVPAELSPDPLADIQARPIADFSSSTFVPPPEVNHAVEVNGNLPFDQGLDQSMGDADWFTLPLDHLFTSSNGQLDSGLGGIGDTDFIDVITGTHNSNLNQWSNNIYIPGQGVGGMNGF